MKIFKMILCAVALVALTACGGYNKEKAKEYADKIKKDPNVSFNDKEVSEMIDILYAASKEVFKQANDTIGNTEKKKKYEDNNDIKIMIENVDVIADHLSDLKSKKKLSNDNLKKYNDTLKKITLMGLEHQKKCVEKSTKYDWNKK